MPSTDLLKLVSPTKERDPQPLTLKKDLSHIAISPLTFAFGKSGASLPPPPFKNRSYSEYSICRSYKILENPFQTHCRWLAAFPAVAIRAIAFVLFLKQCLAVDPRVAWNSAEILGLELLVIFFFSFYLLVLGFLFV